MVVNAAPRLPDANIPKAVPCLFFGYHTEVNATPAAKELPMIPKARLKNKNEKNEFE